jgi:exodeoxyribonuclease VII small subunit
MAQKTLLCRAAAAPLPLLGPIAADNLRRFSEARRRIRSRPMSETKKRKDISTMSFEEALAELQGLVKELEKGEGKLDEAVDTYKRGIALKEHCERKLRDAQERIAKIVIAPDGAVTAEAIELE